MRRDINFFSVYRPSQSSSELDKFKILSLSLLAGSLLVVLVAFSSIKITDISVIQGINSENAYLKNASVSEAKAQLESTKAKLEVLNAYLAGAKAASSEYAKIPKPDSQILKTIEGMEPDDVSVSNISYTGGVLSLSCQCKNDQSPAVFVHTLKESGKFANVNYSGMAKDSDKSGNFKFTTVITLKGGAGK